MRGSYLHYSLPSQDGGGGEMTALEGEFLGRQSLVVGDVTTAAIVQQRADDLQHVTWENQESTRAPSWQLLHTDQELCEIRSCVRSGAV